MLYMIVSSFRMLRIAVFIIATLYVSPTILSAAEGVSAEVNYFELYTKIIRATETGKLDKSIGREARSLNSELQKKISVIDTRLNTLKIASKKQEGSKRDMLLDDLIATGAERERVYLGYFQRLEQLGGLDKKNSVKPAVSTTDGKTEDDGSHENQSSSSQAPYITFESVPEDISSGQFE